MYKLKWDLVIEFGDLFVIAARITQTNAGTKRSFVSDVRAHPSALESSPRLLSSMPV